MSAVEVYHYIIMILTYMTIVYVWHITLETQEDISPGYWFLIIMPLILTLSLFYYTIKYTYKGVKIYINVWKS